MYLAVVQRQLAGVMPELNQRLLADPGNSVSFCICVQCGSPSTSPHFSPGFRIQVHP